ERRAHAGVRRVLLGHLVDLAVRGPGHLGEPLLRRAVVIQVVELLHGYAGGHLARAGAAHPVGHREQRRALEERVLVSLALAPDVAARRLLDYPKSHSYSWQRYSVSPMRIV